MSEFIYLDYNATTPVAPEVLDQMLPWMTQQPWNAASAHAGGRAANAAVEQARQQVADLVGSSPREIVWTSGSTEANNLAIKGVMREAGDRTRILVAATEHKAVLESAYALEGEGVKIEELAVRRDGLLDLDGYQRALGPDVALVSVMLANNETGVIQPLKKISQMAAATGALVHTDATQAPGRMALDVHALAVDLASFSAHKFYGPKGIGALYVRRGVRLQTQQHGGGHESGLRSGTSNVPGIIGMGAAAALAVERLEQDTLHYTKLASLLLSELRAHVQGIQIVAEGVEKLPNTLNIRAVGADGEAVLVNAPSVLISTGSACTSRIPDASHVLQAMGLSQEEAYECLRFSVGRGTTEPDVAEAAHVVASAVGRVRQLTSKENLA